jgi:hypothetical protein
MPDIDHFEDLTAHLSSVTGGKTESGWCSLAPSNRGPNLYMGLRYVVPKSVEQSMARSDASFQARCDAERAQRQSRR